MDPPLVAAAYNAGALYPQNGNKNRWKLRQYPIGTGKHCDRFVSFFNDAVVVLSTHDKKPVVSFLSLMRYGSEPRPRPQIENTNSISVHFAANTIKEDVSVFSLSVLKQILGKAGLTEALISSTSRDPYNQARVMFNNLEKYGVEHQKKLYGRSGGKIIDVYAKVRREGAGQERTILSMKDKIIEVGPSNVSRHACDPRILNVFDVAPSSIKNKRAFEKAIKSDHRVKIFYMPPTDPGYHLEIPQPRT